MKIEKVWVDDLRDPNNFVSDKNYLDYLIWVKTYSVSIDVINTHESTITTIHLDNDLGEEKEGRHVFNHIEELLHEGKLGSLKTIIIHSSNYGAVDLMMSAKDIIKEKYGITLTKRTYNI